MLQRHDFLKGKDNIYNIHQPMQASKKIGRGNCHDRIDNPV